MDIRKLLLNLFRIYYLPFILVVILIAYWMNRIPQLIKFIELHIAMLEMAVITTLVYLLIGVMLWN